MNTKLMDECFMARMEEQRNRFPLQEFRRLFVQEYARRGLVMIQAMTVDVRQFGVLSLVPDVGFIFRFVRHRDIALALLRRWGFHITVINESERKVAYIVQLPEEYLRNKISSDKVGEVQTGLRSNLSRDARKSRHKPSFAF